MAILFNSYNLFFKRSLVIVIKTTCCYVSDHIHAINTAPSSLFPIIYNKYFNPQNISYQSVPNYQYTIFPDCWYFEWILQTFVIFLLQKGWLERKNSFSCHVPPPSTRVYLFIKQYKYNILGYVHFHSRSIRAKIRRSMPINTMPTFPVIKTIQAK